MRHSSDERIGRIKVISFDGDMTLWDFDRVMRHSLGHALAELRKRHPCAASEALTIDEMIEIRNRVAAELEGRVTHLEELRLRAFERTVKHVGSADRSLAKDLNALYLEHRFEDVELYDDVAPALDRLGRRFQLGMISNGNGYPERCGLAGRFGFVVFSQEAGVAKPDPGIFRAACRQARCGPDELMHVGDSLESDVQGANGVGALSVWLNRRRAPNPSRVRPDLEVSSLLELSSILARR